MDLMILLVTVVGRPRLLVHIPLLLWTDSVRKQPVKLSKVRRKVDELRSD